MLKLTIYNFLNIIYYYYYYFERLGRMYKKNKTHLYVFEMRRFFLNYLLFLNFGGKQVF